MTLVKTMVLKNQGVTLVLSNNNGDYAYDLRIFPKYIISRLG